MTAPFSAIDAVDEVQVAGDPSQFVEDPAGDQQHDDALRAGGGDRVAHRRVQHVAASDGAVVIQRDDRQFHRLLLGECST